MIEGCADLWEFEPADARCITTNGFVKNDGCAVMGRGCAKEAAARYEQLPLYLGQSIKYNGNHVRFINPIMMSNLADTFILWSLVFFPVKHHWRDQADINLIMQSSHELVELTNKQDWETVLLPRPGCGNGRLRWKSVRDLIAPILDDRFVVITKEV